jgi:hypothetical protein
VLSLVEPLLGKGHAVCMNTSAVHLYRKDITKNSER